VSGYKYISEIALIYLCPDTNI